MLNFGNRDTEFPVPNSAAWVCVECPKWKRKKKFWQTNYGNAIAEIGKKNVVPRSGESKKKKCYVNNIFTINHMWLVIISLNLNLTLRLFF